MIGKKTVMTCFEVLSQKLPGRDCGTPWENSDYSVSDTRLVGPPPNIQDSEAFHLLVLTGCCGLKWSMIRPQKEVCRFDIQPSWTYFHMYCFSLFHTKKVFSTNDAMIAASDELPGRVVMRRKEPDWKCSSR